MSVKPSVNRFEVDGEHVLRAAGLAAATTDVRSNAFALDKLSAYWNDADDRAVPHQFAVVVEVESISNDPETYDFEIAVGNDPDGADVVLETRRLSAEGRAVFVVSREAIKAAQNDATHLTVNMNGTANGGSLSCAWNAYVAPLVGN